MRSLLFFLIFGAALLLAGFLWTEVRRGSALRDLEVRAASHAEAIMRAQEARRLRPQEDEEAPLYASLDTLMEEGLLQGFQPVPAGRGGTIHARDGYLFLVQLLPSPDPEGIRPTLGQRYRLWSWPRQRDHQGLVLYYGSSAGYLFQGENGECSGLEPLLPERTPLQALDAAQEGARGEARRWQQLCDIRADAAPGAAAPQK